MSQATGASAHKASGVDAATTAKKEGKKGKRGNAAPNDLRNVEKIADSFLKEFPFAEDQVDKLKKAVNKAIQSQRTKDKAHGDDHEWVRSNLGEIFGGTIERHLRKLPVKGPDGILSDNVQRKEKFGERWRTKAEYYFTPEQTDELKALGYDK